MTGDEATGSYMNPADANFRVYNNMPVIDVLLQVWGNDCFYNTSGNGVSISFLEGIVPGLNGNPSTLYTASAGVAPLGLNNGQWNWLLLEINNPIDTLDNNRYLGDPNYTSQYGGVNGGTLRIQGIGSGLTIRAIAVGPQGAFGTSNQVNVFAASAPCPAEPAVNLAYIDVNQKLTNNLTIINNASLGYTYTVQSGVGPPSDQRTAILCTSGELNFAILNNYLGQPCNAPRPMKLCVEFYDDPALVGTSFQPGTYATDAQGDTASYTGPAYTTTGTGGWVKLAFWLSSVDLYGVNTAPLTGGPTLEFLGFPPFIDRIELGVMRTGTNALAGQDPDPTYLLNPLICTTNYGYYAEWDAHDGITNNVQIGTSGGDQNMVVQITGPGNDLRLAVAPAPNTGNNNIQFALENQAFGPNYQDNARVAMRVTYYDDPDLAGASIYPGAYYTLNYGIPTILGAPPAPYNTAATLKGTGRWVDAYFDIPNVNFQGVNQGPQSVIRLQTTPAIAANLNTGDIFVSRVRYDVIRPCGPFEGINMLQTIGITPTNQNIAVTWFGSATLQAAPLLTGPYANVASITDNLTNAYVLPTTNRAQFYRLDYPPYPAYLLPH
jgi:hypothetical protein